jgi:hypothetical protein
MSAATRSRRSASEDADESPPLLRLLDAAEEAGELDVRQVAGALGLDVGALRAALATPAALDRAQREALGAALGIDRARLRALLGPIGLAAPAESPATDDGGVTPPAGARPATSEPDAPPPPRSTAELLERTVLAIDDAAPWGRAARLAVLDAAERGATAAGRAVPRELHALRARVRAAPAPALDEPSAEDGAGAPRPRGPLPPEDVQALDDAVVVIRTLQGACAGYDDLFAPVHDEALEGMLRRFTLAVHDAPLGATCAVVVTPALYGRAVLVRSAQASADQRRVALRTALAHAAAGHVREERPLPAPAPLHERRVAALAALADLVPFWQLAHARRRARLGWSAIADDVARQAARLAGDWPWAWTCDLARLRVALYRRDGL